MNINGMYMLKNSGYETEKMEYALEVLYKDRKNEFNVLSQAFLGKEKLDKTPNWKEFVLNFCLDVSDSFKTWSNQKPPSSTSPQKALTILRQIGNGKKSMRELTQILDIAFDLAEEFKNIYKRIK